MASNTRSTNRGGGRNPNRTNPTVGTRGRRGGRSGNRAGGRIQGRGTEFITRGELMTEMGILQDNIQAMFDQARRNETDNPNIGLEGEVPITPTVVTIPRRCDYKAFLNCKPPTYSGERDPVKAIRWLKEMEAIFKTIKCANEDRVLYGTTMLKSDALYWWETCMSTEGSDIHTTTTWNEFAIAFKEQFCPQASVKDLEEEFMNLHQQGLSVRDYTASFIEKSRFAEYYVATEKLKVDRYIYGLSSDIRKLVTAKEPKTFSEAVEAAENMEQDMKREVECKGTGKRKVEEATYESEGEEFQEFEDYQEYDSYEIPCSKCHSIHQGDCYGDSRSCYKCGKIGHIARDCRVVRYCYYCKSPEHLLDECPSWKAKQDNMMAGSAGNETGKVQSSGVSKGKGKVYE